MNRTITTVTACVALAFASQAFGQACTADGTIIAAGTQNADTCTGTFQLAQTCGGTTPMSGAKQYIYSVMLGAGATGSLAVNATTIAPYIGLMSGAACNSNDTCGGSQENVGAAGTSVSVPLTGLSAGQYWFVVTDQGSGCSPFTLTVTPTLPVELKNFSID